MKASSRKENIMLSISNDRFKMSAGAACLLMAAITIARGTSFLMSKQLLGTMEPFNLLGVRFLMAFAILFILFAKRIVAVIRDDKGVVFAAALLGAAYFVCMAAELHGLKYTASSTCSFLENSAIVMVPVCEAIILRRMPARIIMTSAFVTMAGIGFIVLGGDGMGIGKGELLCMLAALMYTAAIIITDRASKKHDPFTLGVLYVGFMGAAGLAASLLTESSTHLPQTGGQWAYLLMLAVICSAFGFTMQPVAQKYISTETAGILIALNPLTSAVLGNIILGEAFGVKGLTGSVLIICGIMLPNIIARRNAAPAVPAAAARVGQTALR
jgi:drug/metabolite transporter (DMT)-like permease